MANEANDLQKFMDNARERKKNEALASRIFDKNRRLSAPSKLITMAGGSLAQRVGIKKRASLGTNKAKTKASDVNGEWTHDLHNTLNTSSKTSASLSSRISKPGSVASKRANTRRAAALERMDVDTAVQQQVNIRPPPSQGISIRGLAGPFTVMGQNFAPGTTAADIESAMTPYGGEMESCKIVKTKPFIVVEMVFASREGGESVIETFNNKTADGRLLNVYPKIGGMKAAVSGTKPNGNGQVIDGSLGFAESSRPLYSDKLIGANGHNSNRNGRARTQGQRGSR